MKLRASLASHLVDTEAETPHAIMATEQPQRRRRKRGMLKLFYGSQEKKEDKGNPLDIDGNAFDADQYMQRLMSTAPLRKLMAKDEELGREVKALDSDMQTLVYENYNKFISATDTIRRMKSQVENMEAQMTRLQSSMDSIGDLSTGIAASLAPRRERITKLSNAHLTLKKLQFLFELPSRLKQCIDMGAREQAVEYYARARVALDTCAGMESFRGIHAECQTIVNGLHSELAAVVADKACGQRALLEALPLLLKLSDEPLSLCDTLLARTQEQWVADCANQRAKYPFDPDFVLHEWTPEELAEKKAEQTRAEAEAEAAGEDAGAGEAEGEVEVAEATEKEEEQGQGGGGDGEGSKLADTAAAAAREEEAASEALAADKAALFGSRPKQAAVQSLPAAAVAGEEEDKAAAAAEAEAAAANKADEIPLPEHPLLDFVGYGNRCVLLNLAEWVMAYQDTFLAASSSTSTATSDGGDGDAGEEATVAAAVAAAADEAEGGMAGEEEGGGGGEERAQEAKAATAASPSSSSSSSTSADYACEARVRLHALLKQLATEYLGAVEKRVLEEMVAGTPTRILVAALDQVHAGVCTMDGVAPRARLARLAADTAVRIVQRLCRERAFSLHQQFGLLLTETAEALVAGDAAGVTGHIESLLECVRSGSAGVLDELLCVPTAGFAQSHVYFRRMFAARSVKNGIVQSFLASVVGQTAACAGILTAAVPALAGDILETEMGEEGGESAGGAAAAAARSVAGPISPLFLLVLSKLCLRLGADLVTEVMTTAARLYPSSPSSGDSGLSDADELAAAEHTSNAKRAARAALGASARMMGGRICTQIRMTLRQDWTSWPKPTAVRPEIIAVADAVSRFADTVHALYPRPVSSKAALTTQAGGPQSSMMANIHSLFSDKILVMAPVEPRHESIMMGVIRLAAKSLSEYARAHTYSTYGLQQVETDVHYLHIRFFAHVRGEEDESVLETLLSKAGSSASGRCADPVHLEGETIEAICRSSLL